VMWQGRPIACINIHYILSAMTMAQVVERYLPLMRGAAARIEEALVDQGGPDAITGPAVRVGTDPMQRKR